MNVPNLAKIKPYEYGDKLLISLDKKWFDFFAKEEFTVSIKNDQLIISIKLDTQKIKDHKTDAKTN